MFYNDSGYQRLTPKEKKWVHILSRIFFIFMSKEDRATLKQLEKENDQTITKSD